MATIEANFHSMRYIYRIIIFLSFPERHFQSKIKNVFNTVQDTIARLGVPNFDHGHACVRKRVFLDLRKVLRLAPYAMIDLTKMMTHSVWIEHYIMEVMQNIQLDYLIQQY